MNERLYKIGEAARILELESYILRYWETEFSQLVPKRTPKGQRLYSKADLELLFELKYLLHEQGLTIEGARRVLSGESELALTTTIEKPIVLTQGKEKSKEEDNTKKLLVTILRSIEQDLILIQQLLKETTIETFPYN